MTKLRDLTIIVACLISAGLDGYYLKARIVESIHPNSVSWTNVVDTSPAPKVKTQKQWATAPPEVSPPPDHPPLVIIGGAGTFTIHYTTHEWLIANKSGAVTIWQSGDDSPGLDGLENTVWMYRGDPGPRATLMHELLHIAKGLGDKQNFQTNDPPGQDHEFITNAAPELLLILRRNPKLVRWLMDGNPTMQE